MNRIIFILLFSLLFSCDKDEPQSLLTGQWQWVQAQGGIAGITILPNENLQKSLFLSSKNEYIFVENGNTIINRKYRVINKESIYTGKKVDMIIFEDIDDLYMSFRVTADSLFLSDEVSDGFTNTFVRKK